MFADMKVLARRRGRKDRRGDAVGG
jgi:hypothetical protein